MKLGYICVNFNSSSASVHAVQSLRSNAGHELHVVVVDNGSAPSELSMLEGLTGPDCEVVSLKSNLGYFGGLNAGIRRLRLIKPDFEWMVIGNNDLEFPADFCARLERVVDEHEDRLVISPDIVTPAGEHQNPHVISGVSVVREVVYDLYYSNYYFGMLILKCAGLLRSIAGRSDERQWEKAQPIHQGHGSAYVLGPAFFRVFEELWAPTFMMSEEYFLSKQLSDVGEKVYYDPRITVRHMVRSSLKAVPHRQCWEYARESHRVYRKHVGFGGARRLWRSFKSSIGNYMSSLFHSLGSRRD